MEITTKRNSFFLQMKDFPPLDNGKVNLVDFLEAADHLILLVERLGKVFAPVKYDMQGNIDKIKKFYVFDEESCLLETIHKEVSNNKYNGAESILWLNRAIYFFELIFQELLKYLPENNNDINMTSIYTVAYEGSVKKYHNWITQKIFALICKMSPSFPQIMISLEADDHMEVFITRLTEFNAKLDHVRSTIDDFFKENNLFQE